MNQALTLRDRNDMLREELRQAHEALIGPDPWLLMCIRLRIPRKPEILMRTLYKHPFVTKEMVRVALDIPGTWCRKVEDSYQRDSATLQIVRRIMPRGSVLCLSMRGYFLSQHGREWLTKELGSAIKDNTP
jgi:hypothetical protein